MPRGRLLLSVPAQRRHDESVPSRLRVYFSRAWWSLALTGGLLIITVALAVWWIMAGDDAPGYVEPLTVVCGTGVALLELIRPGRKADPAEDLGPPEYVLLTRTFGRAVPAALQDSDHLIVPCAKVMGAARERRCAFRPNSVVNLGGSALDGLTGDSVEALNRGAALAGCLHTTGDMGVTEHHRRGGDLVFRISPGYVGCRDQHGKFDLTTLQALAASAPIRALEIDLRHRRSVPDNEDLMSGAHQRSSGKSDHVRPWHDRPARHAEFSDPDSLLDWVELLAQETGLPVGLRPTVGDMAFWDELTALMDVTGRGVDFVTIDTSPVMDAPRFHAVLTLPYLIAVSRVYANFARRGLQDDVVFVGSGGADNLYTAMAAFALGCDAVEVGGGLLHILGHTVKSEAPWTRRPRPEQVASNVARRVRGMSQDLLHIAETGGVGHPGLLDAGAVMEVYSGLPLHEMYGYEPGWGLPSARDQLEIIRIMAPPDAT